MEDALISPEGLSILTGAGLISASTTKPIYQHVTSQIELLDDATINLPEIACYNTNAASVGMQVTGDTGKLYEKSGADIFVMVLEEGIVANEPCVPSKIEINTANKTTTITCDANEGAKKGKIVLVDYYIKRIANTQQIEITADKFGGYYYIEASTLFRDEATGQDLPAEFIIPNGKVQSNFNFALANSGDPSTFAFTVDAMPGYTKFDGTKKVLATIQIIEDAIAEAEESRPACNGEIDNGSTSEPGGD